MKPPAFHELLNVGDVIKVGRYESFLALIVEKYRLTPDHWDCRRIEENVPERTIIKYSDSRDGCIHELQPQTLAHWSNNLDSEWYKVKE